MTEDGSSKGKKRKWPWKRWTRDLVLFAVIIGGISLWQGRNLLASGAIPPEVELVDLEGGTSVQLADLRGKKVLLYFWAPWCGVCKAVSPNVRWLAESGGVEVVSIASDSDVASVRAARPEDFSSLALLGVNGAAQAFSVNAYPTFYVLDEEGRIQRSFMGYTTKLGLWLRTR